MQYLFVVTQSNKIRVRITFDNAPFDSKRWRPPRYLKVLKLWSRRIFPPSPPSSRKIFPQEGSPIDFSALTRIPFAINLGQFSSTCPTNKLQKASQLKTTICKLPIGSIGSQETLLKFDSSPVDNPHRNNLPQLHSDRSYIYHLISWHKNYRSNTYFLRCTRH